MLFFSVLLFLLLRSCFFSVCLFSSFLFAYSFPLHRFRTFFPALFSTLYLSQSFFSAVSVTSSFFFLLLCFLCFACSLCRSHLLSFKLHFSFKVGPSPADCSAKYCVIGRRPSTTRTCSGCDYNFHNRDDAVTDFGQRRLQSCLFDRVYMSHVLLSPGTCSSSFVFAARAFLSPD